MVSHNSFRLLGYFYAGLCLCSSFLLLINASQLIKQNRERHAQRDMAQIERRAIGQTSYQETWQSSYSASRPIDNDPFTIGVSLLIFSIISTLFDTFLIAGIVERRIKYVKYHLEFVSFIYALVLIGLFVGCIITGIAATTEIDDALGSACLVAGTVLFIFGIVLVSIFYALTLWVLKGVMNFIKYEIVRFGSSEGGELV